MPETGVQSAHIHERAKELFQKPSLQEAYRSSTLRLYTHRLQAISEVPGFEALRDRARALKREVIEHLDEYLAQFADQVERLGGKVHWRRLLKTFAGSCARSRSRLASKNLSSPKPWWVKKWN